MSIETCRQCDISYGHDRSKKCWRKDGTPCGELVNQDKPPGPRQLDLIDWLDARGQEVDE